MVTLQHVSFSPLDISCKEHFQNSFARDRFIGPIFLLMKINQCCPVEVNALTLFQALFSYPNE